jgi:putative component of toxin-antitoxin plasmid stabilization module
VSRDARISSLQDRSTEDERTGAMRSVQEADLCLAESTLSELWSPMYLERLARTYWRFLTRVTLGVVRVVYTESERYVVLLARPLKLLTFKAPEYDMGPEHGLVRWRIERGLLVARHGRGGHGHLQIDVRRLPSERPGEARVRVRVEVANFHPAIATGLGRRVYYATQAKIHVFVTNGFLRSLRRLDLAESKVGLLVPPH